MYVHVAYRGHYIMFKTQVAMSYRDLKPQGAAEWF